MLTEFLFPIMVTFLVDKMVLLLPEKLITYLSLTAFRKQVCIVAIRHILKFVMRKIATVIENQFVKHVKKITHFFKKKNLHVPNYKSMV